MTALYFDLSENKRITVSKKDGYYIMSLRDKTTEQTRKLTGISIEGLFQLAENSGFFADCLPLKVECALGGCIMTLA